MHTYLIYLHTYLIWTDEVEAVVIPGGFGAAKNLSDFGFKGADMSVNQDVEKVFLDFHQAGKPIALCCIAPIIAAKVFGSSGVEVSFNFCFYLTVR